MKILVLCIDRDNDIGNKTSLVGPIIGKEDNVKAANQLAFSDPEDTDVNAIFAALKLMEEFKSEGEAEVATITGDEDRGVKADANLSKQLDILVEKLKPDGVVIVTDGKSDEQIIPIVSSRAKIISLQTVVVRQSKELEKAYFTALNFLNEVLSQPKMARLVIGLPGIILVLLAMASILLAFEIVRPIHVWIVLFGAVGGYLVIKGFGLEEIFIGSVHGFITSFSTERIALLTYVIAGLVMIVGAYNGYINMVNLETPGMNFIEKLALFILGAHIFFLLAIGSAIGGRIYDNYVGGNYLQVRSYIITLVLGLLIILAVTFGAAFILGMEGISLFVLMVLFGVGVIAFILTVEATKRTFKRDIGIHKRARGEFVGKEVYDTKGKYIGKVSDILIKNYEVCEIKAGKQVIPRENIKSSGEIIMVEIK